MDNDFKFSSAERKIHSPWFQPWDNGKAQIILPQLSESPIKRINRFHGFFSFRIINPNRITCL